MGIHKNISAPAPSWKSANIKLRGTEGRWVVRWRWFSLSILKAAPAAEWKPKPRNCVASDSDLYSVALCLACGKDVRDHTSLTTICEICGKAPTLRQPISSHFPPITSNMGLRDTIRNLRPASPGRENHQALSCSSEVREVHATTIRWPPSRSPSNHYRYGAHCQQRFATIPAWPVFRWRTRESMVSEGCHLKFMDAYRKNINIIFPLCSVLSHIAKP